MKLNTFLNFGGNCEDAFRFYEQHLGGRITMLMRRSEQPAQPVTWPGWERTVQYAAIDLGGTDLMASDVPPDRFQPMRSVYLSLTVDSAEEAEHKCTAFDIYQALDGSHAWRVRWMRRVTVFFLGDALRQTASNLRADGTLWRWTTWRSAARHLLGRDGLLRTSHAPWKRYFRRDFHPNQQHSDLSERWLEANAQAFVRVGTGA